MKICLIVEGCYPYVAGGVSSWIQLLIEGMPEHEFIIFSIGAEQKYRGVFKYKIPSNLTLIDEHFLDEYFVEEPKLNRRYKLTAQENDAFYALIEGSHVDWGTIFEMFNSHHRFSPNDFLSSKNYFDMIKKVAETKYEQVSFNDVFWTIRSMLLPLLNILSSQIIDADIYHCVSTGYAGVVGAYFKYFTHKPLIISEHGIYTREREEEILKAKWVSTNFKSTWIDFFTAISNAAYEASDWTAALFHNAQKLQVELGADPKKCIVIPNGIDVEKYKHVQKLSNDSETLNIGAIVRVVPIKDIKTLIYSFDIIKKENPKAILYIIGPNDENPEYYQECMELVEALNLDDVYFTGRVDISEWMDRLDLTILTSVSEGQPFVILESFASQRPTIATNVGSCKELIEGNDEFGPAGFVVPLMNPMAIAKAVINLSNNREMMIEYANNGYQRVGKYYKLQDFLHQYKELYQKVVK